MQPLVINVILNTNRKQDTLECLASIQRSTYANRRTLVLDNASTDGSPEAVRAAHPDVEVVGLTANLGYAGNNNVGLKLALQFGADWIVLLNEDTVVGEECLARMVEVGESDARIGIVGPLVYHYDEPGVIQSAGGKLGSSWESYHLGQNQRDRGQFGRPLDVDWISGCCLMVRRQTVEQIGGIDERYFYYWEETEFCMRAAKQGWRILMAPRAKLWHKGVQRNYEPKPSVTYYATRNRLLTLSKHRAPLAVRLVAWWQLVRTMASWTFRPRWRHMRPHRNAMWHGMRDLWLQRWGRMPE